MSVSRRGRDSQNRTEVLFSVPGQKDVQNIASDIDYDFVCDPCADEGHQFEAYGFCSDCNHYLCETCYSAHRRPIPMRNHKLLDKNEMPKIRTKQIFASNEVIEEKCDVHVGKLVEFYCGNHDTIGCSVCMTLEHKSCDGVQFVPHMKIDKGEVEEVMKQLSAFNSNAKTTQSRAKERVSITKCSFDNAQHEAEQFSKKMKGFIERLEKNMENTIQVESKNEAEKVENIIESLEETVQKTESLSGKLTGYMSLNNKANSFITMKKAEKFMDNSSLEDCLDVSECRNAKYVFVPNKELLTLQDEIECLGIVEQTSEHIKAEPSPFKEVEVLLYYQFTVQAKDDTSDCKIVGTSKVSDPCRDVIADAGNNKIKVIKGYSNTITTSLKLSAKPYAMANILGNKVCVTIPEEKKILLITISKLFRKDIIKIAKTLACGFKCYGIATKGENIMIVSCEYEGGSFAINSMNADGQILDQFKCIDNEPMYIAVQNEDIYTLDTKRGLLKRLSILDGSMKNERKIENVTHFTMTDDYVVAVTGLPQVPRVFSQDFQDIDAEWSIDGAKITPVHVGDGYTEFFIGCYDGRVHVCTISQLDESGNPIKLFHQILRRFSKSV